MGFSQIKKLSTNQNSTPTIVNIPVPTKNTEVSYTFPDGTIQFSVRSRRSPLLKIAYLSGQSDVEYVSVSHTYEEDNLNPLVTIVLYFQSIVDSDVVEVLSWSSN